MHIRAISGFGSKSAACFLVETEGRRFLLDLGKNDEDDSFPDLSGIGKIDAILISHGHADHIGGLALTDMVGSPPVYATEIVRTFGGHPALENALDLPLQGHIDIAGVSVECGRAGHAPGGVWMCVGGAEGVLYSGDYSAESILYACDPLPQARRFIVDASYGIYNTPLADAIETLDSYIAKGPCFLPSPPAGRGLEMAVTFSERGHRIALCPAHLRAAALLLGFESTLLPGARERLTRLLDKARPLAADSAAEGIMLAAAATAKTGLAKDLFERFARTHEAEIVFTGHIAGEMPRAMIARGEAHMIRWNVHPTLTGLQNLLATAKPDTVLAAFVEREKIAPLAQACNLQPDTDGWLGTPAA